MIAGDFEWDDDKAAANLAKHGIAFEVAILAFNDPQAREITDIRKDYGERRINLYGRVTMDGTQEIVLVCHVTRARIRIISARFANRRERTRLFQE